MNGVASVEDYARLAVEVGLNLASGQDVLVVGDVDHAPPARAVVRAAYERGARFADVEYRDRHIRRARVRSFCGLERSGGTVAIARGGEWVLR